MKLNPVNHSLLYKTLGFLQQKIPLNLEITIPKVELKDRREQLVMVTDVIIVKSDFKKFGTGRHRMYIKCPLCTKKVPTGRIAQHFRIHNGTSILPYANPESSVKAFRIFQEYIQVQFKSGKVYIYTKASVGEDNLVTMKQLAIAGKGLGSFINTRVKKSYHDIQEDFDVQNSLVSQES